MTRCVYLAALLATSAAGPGCRNDEPVEAFLRFVEALQSGKSKLAWGQLAKADRERLRARAERLGSLTGGKVQRAPHELLLVTSLDFRRSKRSVKILETRDNRSLLRINLESGGTEKVQMVKEEDGWKVLLQPPPSPAKTPKR